ncbi:hypothetical protein ERO13_D06G203900v2 [Gossypium hirsutum]|uniref:ALA-interacting subunit n=1 Tax=Gossypium hirsutum TaxID=3635 RepID=A0ABM3ABF0_GOSHI|nr:putative ALA-interacting subunit 2 [Gossypium hirsutum]KAG4143648.1 hypothetical protein ERO13_D06G203900v2 [Gossypium hirsutum]
MDTDRERHRARETAFYLFTQQSLPACKPVLTPGWVIAIFLFMGVIFIPVGLITLRASHCVVEIVDRYDIDCVPEPSRMDKVSYIQDDSIPKNCSHFMKVHKYMKAPIYIYYQLDNYYQNHRRYVKSRSDKQLLDGQKYHDTSSCQPVESNNNRPIVPCGLIAWSLFNDTFEFIREGAELKVNRKNIAWKSDRGHKFGKNVYPFNFQNGTLIGGGKLNPEIPLSDQEDLIVWMRTSALPSFRKLYGRIEEDLDVDDVVVVNLMNNYNTYSFGGKKKLVLSTSSWLGGKNDFLGHACVFVGCSSLTLAIIFMLLHVKYRRPYGDMSYLPWNRKSFSG